MGYPNWIFQLLGSELPFHGRPLPSLVGPLVHSHEADCVLVLQSGEGPQHDSRANTLLVAGDSIAPQLLHAVLQVLGTLFSPDPTPPAAGPVAAKKGQRTRNLG